MEVVNHEDRRQRARFLGALADRLFRDECARLGLDADEAMKSPLLSIITRQGTPSPPPRHNDKILKNFRVTAFSAQTLDDVCAVFLRAVDHDPILACRVVIGIVPPSFKAGACGSKANRPYRTYRRQLSR